MQTPSPPRLSRSSRLADFFGLKRNLVILLVAIFVIGAGEELWMRFVPKYLQAVGATVFVIGLYDALRTLLGAIYAYPGGVLVDRWGHRRVFIIFSWTCFSLPATFSLIGAALEANRHSMGIGVQSVIKRLPIMIAPIFGGMLIDRFGIIGGVRIALIVSIFLSALTILVQRQLREEPREEAPADERWSFWQSLREFNRPMRRLLLSDILIRFCERIPYAWVVIFAMDYIGVSGEQVGVLTAIEMLAATLCIIPASHYADRHGREPFVIATFIMFTLFPISLLMSRSFPALVVAFVIRGLKEFGDTSRKALIIGYSDSNRRGQMVGAYYLVRDLIVSTGAILGAYLWKVGPGLNFLGAAALGATGTIFYVKTIRQSRQAALNDLKKQLEMRRTRWK